MFSCLSAFEANVFVKVVKGVTLLQNGQIWPFLIQVSRILG